jgi:hypothetical protein
MLIEENMTLRLYGKNSKIWLTEQGTSAEDVGINLSGASGSVSAKRGDDPLFSVEADEAGHPGPYDILIKYPDRTKQSGLKLAKFRPNSPLVQAIFANGSIDRLLDGCYVIPNSENCPADVGFQAILQQKAFPPLVKADESYICTAVMQKVFMCMAKAYKDEMAMGFSIDNPSSLVDGQYVAGSVLPSAAYIAYVATQPWWEGRRVTVAKKQADLKVFRALKEELEQRCPLNIETLTTANEVDTLHVITWYSLYECLFLLHTNAALQLSGHDDTVELTGADEVETFAGRFNVLIDAIMTGGSAGNLLQQNTDAVASAVASL